MCVELNPENNITPHVYDNNLCFRNIHILASMTHSPGKQCISLDPMALASWTMKFSFVPDSVYISRNLSYTLNLISTFLFQEFLRYRNLNIVESGIKHHNPNPFDYEHN